MVQAEINQQLAEQQSRALAALFIDNPETRKRIRKIVRAELLEAAKRLREDARYEMKDDPRKAYRAVKSTVYRNSSSVGIAILLFLFLIKSSTEAKLFFTLNNPSP